MTVLTNPTIDDLARKLTAGVDFNTPLELRFGQCRIRVRTNSAPLTEKLTHYFRAYADDSGDPDYELSAVQCVPPDLGLEFSDWPRDPGKVGRKDTIRDIDGGRVLRKVRTDMQFLVSPGTKIAFGDCLTNDNQVINFVISQYLGWLRNRDWEICHAAGIILGEKGIGIAAFSGGGKSTLALHLMSLGATFVSNDRLLIGEIEGAPHMAGVPKMPRVNPGTLLNNPDLIRVLPEDRRTELGDLPRDRLWELEEKYDVDIEAVFGAGRNRLEGPLSAFIVLNWDRYSEAAFAMNRIDLAARNDLLDAIMKPPGAFFIPSEGDAPRTFSDLDRDDYLTRLRAVPVYEATGAADFAAACETILQRIV